MPVAFCGPAGIAQRNVVLKRHLCRLSERSLSPVSLHIGHRGQFLLGPIHRLISWHAQDRRSDPFRLVKAAESATFTLKLSSSNHHLASIPQVNLLDETAI